MNNPMTPDYITRLAERVATMAAVPGHIAERDYIAAELHTLAQQGKAGGVADTLSGAQLSAFADACCYTEDEAYATLQLLDEAIAKHPPANPPESGVTDEMVERALAWWFSDENSRDDGPETSWAAVQKEYVDGGNWLRESMRKALTAALAPQPKTPEADVDTGRPG